MAVDAFDLTERFQTPIFVMTDLDLGMNNWMSDSFKYPARKFDRGKVLSVEDLQKLGKFERYRDVDGDGIPYRTLPGTDHPAASYFTRGSGHNEKALYSEKPEDYKNNMDRLAKKYETARTYVPQPEVQYAKDARIGFLAFGTTHWAIIESQDQLRMSTICPSVISACEPSRSRNTLLGFQHDRVYVVEQSRWTMASLIKLNCLQNWARKCEAFATTAGSRSTLIRDRRHHCASGGKSENNVSDYATSSIHTAAEGEPIRSDWRNTKEPTPRFVQDAVTTPSRHPS
jgi:2-oxoglutarate ferredoxin oxidoreductase subunit alpha